MLKEREAIEIVEGIVKSYIEADECGLSNNDFKHEIRALQTVLNMLKEKDKRINDLEYALLDMIMQFADRPNIKGSSYALDTMGLSALELAFDELGFDNPYPVKKADEKYQILAKQYFERKCEE